MKRLPLLAIALTFALLVPTLRANAQVYDLSWFTFGGGGDTSVQSDYSLSGTIGQHEADSMTGDGFELTGGFWAVGDDQSSHCGSADFNCDGDIGTDLDIEAFFSCLAGNCPPPPCTNSADFNGDGDIGTDADIEAFFRVLAGGSC
jgi:hypothetical protein